MIAGDNSGFPYNQHHGFHMFGYMDDFNQMLDHPPPLPSDAALELEVSAHLSGTLVYNLSVLRSKVEQVDAMVNVLAASPNLALQPAAAGASSILQEIIVAASSMMMALEQLGSTPAGSTTTRENEQQRHTGMLNAGPQRPPSPNVDVVVHVDRPYSGGFFGDHHDIPLQAGSKGSDVRDAEQKVISAPTFMDVAKVEPSLDDGVSYGSTTSADRIHHEPGPSSSTPSLTSTCDVIELNAADLLAKYTHYCHICGKGFKRDANLRMHMRAHGDEYKTAAALSKSTPRITTTTNSGGVLGGQLPAVDNQGELASSISQTAPRKYSCPQEGCRWNKGHARFQPLKSMICVKNHYRRSHCPKMYVCNRCNKKRFSVLSDLRTHEKHCGDLKWRCSCGTTFSRKDKLMGHVALFAGHAPADCHQLVMDSQKQRLQQ